MENASVGKWNLFQFHARFPNEEAARLHMERVRWPDGPVCPRCGSKRASEVKDQKPMPWRCKDCRKHFSVRIGTIFEKANLPLLKCLLGIHLLNTSKKGMSSVQLAEHLGCTQKTAWYLAHRIRATMQQGTAPLDGDIEVDETYAGGKERNKHASNKLKAGRGPVGKTAIFGMRERGGRVRARPMEHITMRSVTTEMKANISEGSRVMTDEHPVYNAVPFRHERVSHSSGEYVRGDVSTNAIESFWATFKRGYVGVYHYMSGKHLHRYVDEFATRHNSRDLNSERSLALCLRGTEGKHLPYKELIA